jgi:hypothetical protein
MQELGCFVTKHWLPILRGVDSPKRFSPLYRARSQNHTILVIAYHVLARGAPYQDLGGHYFDARVRANVRRHAAQRLQALSYHVHLEPLAEAA